MRPGDLVVLSLTSPELLEAFDDLKVLFFRPQLLVLPKLCIGFMIRHHWLLDVLIIFPYALLLWQHLDTSQVED